MLCIYITFFFHGTQELLLFKKLFLLLHQDGFDTLFQQKVELFWVIAQIFVEDRINTCFINVYRKLLSVKSLCRMHRLRKTGFERKALCLCQIGTAFNFRAVQSKIQ